MSEDSTTTTTTTTLPSDDIEPRTSTTSTSCQQLNHHDNDQGNTIDTDTTTATNDDNDNDNDKELPQHTTKLMEKLGVSSLEELQDAMRDGERARQESVELQLERDRMIEDERLLQARRSATKALRTLGTSIQLEKLKETLGIDDAQLHTAIREAQTARIQVEDSQSRRQRCIEDYRLLQSQRDCVKALRLLGLQSHNVGSAAGSATPSMQPLPQTDRLCNRLGLSDHELHAAMVESIQAQQESYERQSAARRQEEDARIVVANAARADKALKKLGITSDYVHEAMAFVEGNAQRARTNDTLVLVDDAVAPDISSASATGTSEDSTEHEQVAELLASLPVELVQEMLADVLATMSDTAYDLEESDVDLNETTTTCTTTTCTTTTCTTTVLEDQDTL
jgi:hypothetical protein